MKGFLIGLFLLIPGSLLATPLSETKETITTKITSKSKKPIIFGHNLGVTTQTLNRGDVTLGNFVAGVGVTDNFTIATSPWLLNSYNMYSLVSRYRYAIQDNLSLGWQMVYFKTDTFYPNIYQMEAISNSVTLGFQINPIYQFNLTVNHSFFWDETIPYSLRLEPFTDDPYQFSISTLQVIEILENYGASIELGVLGANYKYPYAHAGLSIHYMTTSWLMQFGISASAIAGTFDVYTQTQAQATIDEPNAVATVIHPEIHIQYFF
ncbi:MAG: hypothetical protein KDD61_15690 [Bdellovibrionales bacterium]|nr:hypothetical protein [Bdellovibrionales bacterium]